MLTKVLRISLLGAMTLPLVFGQNDAGRIVGTVTDASGAGVPSAAITIVNEKTGQERKVTGDTAGGFVLVQNIDKLADGHVFQAEHIGPARLIKADRFCHGDFPD